MQNSDGFEQYQVSDVSHLAEYKKMLNQCISSSHSKQRLKDQLFKKMLNLRDASQRVNASQRSFCNTTISVSPRRRVSPEDNSHRIEMGRMEQCALDDEIEGLTKQIVKFREKNKELQEEIEMLDTQQDNVLKSGRDAEAPLMLVHKELANYQANIRSFLINEKRKVHILRQKTQRCRTKANDLRKLSQEKQAHNKSLVISLDRETHYSTRGVYSKMMLEDILRSFYCVMQMEELWEKGRELHIEYIVEKLPTKAEIRLMSKSQIIEAYESKDGGLNDQVAQKVIAFYEKISSTFDVLQRTNQQATSNYKQLLAEHQSLRASLAQIHSVKEQDIMRTLELEEGNLRKLAEKVKAICRVIFQFNIRFQGLLKKIANFNKTLDSIVQSTSNNSRKYRKTYVDVNEVALLKFEMRLQLNPHDVLMLWSSVLTQGERAKEYVQNVIANDLLRLHAVPSMFRPQLDELDNINCTFEAVIELQLSFMTLVFRKLKQLVTGPKIGIQNMNMQGEVSVEPERMLCVQSKAFYRRDNFKILEKAQKVELKKEGILTDIPFNVQITNELDNRKETKPDQTTVKEQDPRQKYCINRSRRMPRNSHDISNRTVGPLSEQRFKYNQISSKREDGNVTKMNLRRVFANLQSIVSANKPQRRTIK